MVATVVLGSHSPRRTAGFGLAGAIRPTAWAYAAVAAVLVLVFSSVTRAMTPENGVEFEGMPEVAWEPCYEEMGPFECARYIVPLDYGGVSRDYYLDASEPGVEIALIRVPAGRASKIGSLFVNPGGPGGSGVDAVLTVGRSLYTRRVRSSFDIVGFDPRGTNRSTALRCFTTPDHRAIFESLVFVPQTFREVLRQLRFDKMLRRACRKNAGRIIDHMTTADTARDLDVLRQAVGDDQLSYAGFSYGSYIGVTYANLFPERVRALIVDAVTDPIAWSTGSTRDRYSPVSLRLGSEASSLEALGEFFRLCELAGPQECAISGDASRRYRRLLHELAAHPLSLPRSDGGERLLDDGLLISITVSALVSSNEWSVFARLLSFLEHREPVQDIANLVDFFVSRLLAISEGSIEGFPGVMCTDSDNPRSPWAWPIAAWIAKFRSGLFGPFSVWVSSPCARWPGSKRSRYVGPFDRETANPVLVMNNRFDPTSPYASAVKVRGLLPNSHLVTVEGWGHVTLFLSPCATQIASSYLLGDDLPAEDSTCYQRFPPFGLSAAEAFDPPEEPETGQGLSSVEDSVDALAEDDVQELRRDLARSIGQFPFGN